MQSSCKEYKSARGVGVGVSNGSLRLAEDAEPRGVLLLAFGFAFWGFFADDEAEPLVAGSKETNEEGEPPAAGIGEAEAESPVADNENEVWDRNRRFDSAMHRTPAGKVACFPQVMAFQLERSSFAKTFEAVSSPAPQQNVVR